MLVACLCAEWCVACREYRPVFDALARSFAAEVEVEFVWIDIEDDSDALGDPDIEDFPTLLVADGGSGADAALFFGPVTPQPQTAERVIRRALDGGLQPLPADAPGAKLAALVAGLAAQRRHAASAAGRPVAS